MRNRRYPESVERSSELLRLAIPLMSRQTAGMHPISYAVWYDYVAGLNGPLIQELDRLLKNGEALDEETTEKLYRQFVLSPDEAVSNEIRAQLGQVIGEVSESAEDSAQQALRYGDRLERWHGALDAMRAHNGAAPSKDDLSQVLNETREIRSSIGALQGVLEAGKREIEQLRRQLQRTQEEATTDALTGLRNRKGFNLALERALNDARIEDAPLSLVLLDIDHFKRVNDTYGHVLGDKVLRLVAQTLRDNVKGADTVARFGGEEFAILLPRTTSLGAKSVAAAACLHVARGRVRDLKGAIIDQVTVSAGIGEYIAGETEEEFIARVDSALYESKAHGRDRVTVAAA